MHNKGNNFGGEFYYPSTCELQRELKLNCETQLGDKNSLKNDK
jgi:hypothetical protein